jgi:hypothetical protein
MATVPTHVVSKNQVGCNLMKRKVYMFMVALAHFSQSQNNYLLPFKVSRNQITQFENLDKIKLAQTASLYLQISDNENF